MPHVEVFRSDTSPGGDQRADEHWVGMGPQQASTFDERDHPVLSTDDPDRPRANVQTSPLPEAADVSTEEDQSMFLCRYRRSRSLPGQWVLSTYLAKSISCEAPSSIHHSRTSISANTTAFEWTDSVQSLPPATISSLASTWRVTERDAPVALDLSCYRSPGVVVRLP